MGRRLNDPEHSRFASLGGPVLLCSIFEPLEVAVSDGLVEKKKDECCRGIDNLELWGPAVKCGSEFKFNSSVECCRACKTLCSGNDGPCLCDTWVFCGNKEACGSRFGECWLKKQKDALSPDRQDAGKSVIWTSGLIFGKGEVKLND
ncbi:Restriction endonuclease, type II-like superfamily protein [Hibiscus syriacus]|uniref:Restriction endonuclease, type II-like superfamily protein n=1 Tax=Hibiscus syriacus TaxID=106335 RepID=A0A6A3C0D5_HIBSY|nr:Restriction endonuclease, type II-like superfamily protein [Hibiscus syriacus]